MPELNDIKRLYGIMTNMHKEFTSPILFKPFMVAFAAILTLALAGCRGEKASPEREAEVQKLMDEEFELYQRGEYNSAFACLDMADSLA